MSTVRLRRLAADHEKLLNYVRCHPRVRLVQAEGNPPERYQLEYCISSLRMVDGDLQQVKSHLVEIVLPLNYPRSPPQCRMLSPVFHPNIAPHAICVGDHWSSGEPLVSIATRIGELLAYQAYNVKSPLNGEAARWVEQNRERLPLDPVSLLVEEESAVAHPNSERPRATQQPREEKSIRNEAPRDGESPQVASTGSLAKIAITCPSCRKRYRVRQEMVGRTAKCVECATDFVVTTEESKAAGHQVDGSES